MERHEHDDDRDLDDPWYQAGERFSSIAAKLRDRYAEIVGEDGPDEDEVRDAMKTIGTAAQSLVESISASMRDPEVRDQMKDASSTFFSAIGQTLSELGEELREPDGRRPPEPTPPEPTDGDTPADDERDETGDPDGGSPA